MTETLTSHYRHAGHRISIVHECEPNDGEDEIRRLLAPQYQSLKRTALDLQYLLDEQVKKLTPWVNRERTWLVCYTGRGVLAGHELRDENARLSELVKGSPEAAFGQNPLLAELAGLKIRHDAFLSQVERALGDSGKGVLMRRIDAHEAGRVLRAQVDPGTGAGWQPLLPDDRIIPRGVRQGEDATALLAPWLNFQVCGVTQTFGDPVKAWVATLTASSAKSGPCLMYPPLSEALNLMPLTRPTTAWSEDGNALFVSPDGRLMPVALAPSNQTKKTSIVAGESGGGKSVFINRQPIILAMSAQQQLPFFAGIDKGFSSQGMVSILRDALPPERQDEVLSVVLRNDAQHCRNLFDIQLGLSVPLSYESEFMENALQALSTLTARGYLYNHLTGEPVNCDSNFLQTAMILLKTRSTFF